MRQTGDLRSVVRLYRREANIDTGDGQVDYGFLWQSYAEVYHLILFPNSLAPLKKIW